MGQAFLQPFVEQWTFPSSKKHLIAADTITMAVASCLFLNNVCFIADSLLHLSYFGWTYWL